MDEYLVSIITPAYNCEEYIAEAIESVLSQTYKNWEMIIVNDMSNDETWRIIKEYQQRDVRIKGISLFQNSGAAVARNTALDKAKGRFIAFLDADDRWKPDKLQVQIEFMVKNNYGFTFSEYEYIRVHENEKKRVFKIPNKLNYSQALKNTTIGCLTVVVDRMLVGDFRMPLVRRGQDHLTWVMLLKNGIIAYGIHKNLAEYRRVRGSLSRNKVKALKRQWHNYRQVLNMPLLLCIYYYVCYIFYNIVKYVKISI